MPDDTEKRTTRGRQAKVVAVIVLLREIYRLTLRDRADELRVPIPRLSLCDTLSELLRQYGQSGNDARHGVADAEQRFADAMRALDRSRREWCDVVQLCQTELLRLMPHVPDGCLVSEEATSPLSWERLRDGSLVAVRLAPPWCRDELRRAYKALHVLLVRVRAGKRGKRRRPGRPSGRAPEPPKPMHSPAAGGCPSVPTDYSIAEVCDMTKSTSKTVNRYAKRAGVTTPPRGGKDHRYSLADVRKILGEFVRGASDRKLRKHCENALQTLPETEE